MIENQNLIFRPWASISNGDLTDSELQDLNSMSCDLITTDCKLTNLNKNLNFKTSSLMKISTDADRLKRMLMSEKSSESRKLDKKCLINKLSSNLLSSDLVKYDQSNQQINAIANGKTPASSSAETRLINSRIAALSSASHLLNLESYSRLTAPINQINGVVSNSTNCSNSISLNFILPDSNVSTNNLSANNNIPIDKCVLPKINTDLHSNSLLNHHQILSTIPNTLPNNSSLNVNLSQPTLPQLNNATLPQSMPNNSALPISVLSTLSFDSKQWNEIVASVSNQQQSSNLITPIDHQCLQTPNLIENNHQFTYNVNSLSSDILMANLKKSNSIQCQFKKNRLKKFICTINQCGSSFANNGQLKTHIRTHTGFC